MIKFIEVSFLKKEMQDWMVSMKTKCSVEAYSQIGNFYDFVVDKIDSCQKELDKPKAE